MPLNIITGNLHNMLAINLMEPLGNTQLGALFTKTHGIASEDLTNLVPQIAGSLSQAQYQANTWLASGSKGLMAYANPASFNADKLKAFVGDALIKFSEVNNELNQSMDALATAITESQGLISFANAMEKKLKSQPLGFLGYGADVIGSGTKSLVNSIGHFFTHGSFSHVSSSPGISPELIYFEHQGIVSTEQLMGAIEELISSYNRLKVILQHIETSFSNSADFLTQFNDSIPSLTASISVPYAQKVLFATKNSLGSINSMVSAAMDV